jgi:A/G-specific adenine glycosylase
LKKLIIKGMDKRYFSKKIVEWYHRHKRNLPWRDSTDPYKIWLSEIILQQTRVNQGLPYYQAFVKRFPTIKYLSNADEQEVLRLWQGLGYYSRARNLHKCAQTVSERFGGIFPKDFENLKTLPGIGDYTAAAIASFAYKEAIGVVDGNVFRVLSRLFGIITPVNGSAGKKLFQVLANELISTAQPDLHNQAIMEFGATFCVPVAPPCDACIFKTSCFAFQHEMQASLPVKTKGKESRKRYFHYLVFKKGKSLLMKKRVEKDIWMGLYDFPLIEHKKKVSVSRILRDPSIPLTGNQFEVTETYKHVLTHQVIFCKFIILPWSATAEMLRDSSFYSLKKISGLPKPVLISRFLDDYAFYS